MSEERVRRTYTFSAGDVVILMVAPTKRALVAMSKRKPPDSWSRAAKRILRRMERLGLPVARTAKKLVERGMRR